MPRLRRVVITKRETLRLLGIMLGALNLLEREAGVRYVPQRGGYTLKELKRLLAAMRRAMGSRWTPRGATTLRKAER